MLIKITGKNIKGKKFDVEGKLNLFFEIKILEK